MKNQLIAISIIASILLTSCWSSVEVVPIEEAPKKQVQTQTIIKDFFKEEIKLVWKVSPQIETPISSQVAGTIKEIKTEVGKEVKKWDILAKIDLGSSTYWTSFNNANTAYNNSLNSYWYTVESIQKDLDTARIQLENARLAKDNTYITSGKQLEIAQTQLNNIKITKNNTFATTGENLKQSQIGIELAQKQLDLAKSNLDNYVKNSDLQLTSLYNQEDSTYDDIKVSLDNALVSIDSTMTQIDIILWVTDKNKYLNDSYEKYLGAKNSDSKLKAEAIFQDAKSQYDSYLKNKNLSSKAKIIDSINKIVVLTQKISELCDGMIVMLDSSITWDTFTQAQLDSLKYNALGSWIVTKQATINTIKWWLISAKNGTVKLTDTINSAKTTIETQKLSLTKTIDISETSLNNSKQAYENLKAWNTTQIDTINGNEVLLQTQLENTIALIKQTRDNIDNTLKIAQSNYDSTNAKLNSQKVAAKNQIDSAKWWKDLAGIQLNNTSIIAPFDWVITGRNIELWWMVNPGTVTFIIGDKSQFKVKMDVNSDNITYLKIGQNAQISRWWKSYTGIISLLSPTTDPTTKMFKSEIIFSEKTEWINLWDFVDVIINKVNSTDKMILVPFSSIISLWQWDYSLFIDDNWIAKTRQVKIGTQNSTQVEIVSWIKEWEKVIVSWTLTLQDWDKVEESK